MTTQPDLFDLEVDPLQRDRYGRPLLIPASGGDRTAYTRMSTLAGYVCDDFGLTTWTQRLLAIGYGMREDLAAMVAALPPLNDAQCDKSTLTKEQQAQDRETKAKLDEYNELALETAGRNYKANHGTAVHGFIQHGHVDQAPERMRPDVESCYDVFRRRGIEVICSEMFVANDRLMAAGSFDHLVRLPTFGIVVADVKGLPLDTPLPTPDGWTTMGEVQVGDRLFGQDGKPCTVVTKSQVHHMPCVRVRFDDGTSVVCDIEHRWAVRVGRTNNAPEQVLTAAEIKSELPKLLAGVHFRVLTPESLDLPDADLPIDPWVLGAWLGDGKHTSGEVTKADEWLFAEFARRGYEVSADYNHGTDKCPTHTIKGLRTQLREAGLLGNKHIPAEYLRASYSQRLALLQGLMDTDGCWNIARHSAEITMVDHALMAQIHELVLSLGQRAKICDRKYEGFGVSGVAHVVTFTPSGLSPFLMPRKRDRVREARGGFSRRRIITAVEDTLLVPTQCIEVDSSNQTYLCTRSMIPTHNTGQAKGKGLQFGIQLSGYADGEVYDPTDDTRAPLESLADGERINRAVGLVVHVPLGGARTELYLVDLNLGRRAASIACQVRDARSAASKFLTVLPEEAS